jgi:O-antigen ligase
MWRWVVLAAGTLGLLVLPTVLAFYSGGFFDKPRLAAAGVVWALVVAVAILSPRPLPETRSGRVALLGLFLLCAWVALSFVWAPLGGRAQDDEQRLLLYLGFMIAGVALLRGPLVRRWLEPIVALGAFVVIAYGLSERFFPQAIHLASSGTAVGRLEQPLTYWNAEGLLAAIGLVLAIHIAGDPSRERWLRSTAAAGGVLLGLGTYLTYARGALGAVAVGLVVLLALDPHPRPQLRAIVTILGASAVAALVANDLSTVKSLSARDVGEGLEMLAALVALAFAAGVTAPQVPRRPIRFPSLPVSRPATVLGISAGLLVAGALVLAATEGKPKGTSPLPGATPARLGSLDSNRYRYWEEAGSTFVEHPLIGIGSGGFQVEWLKVYNRFDASGDAHSLYLETAAELGIVGVGILLLFLGGVAGSVVRLYRRERGLAAGLAAGLSVWAFHAGLDWDWEMPAVTLPALLLAAAAIAWSDDPDVDGSAQKSDQAGEAALPGVPIC